MRHSFLCDATRRGLGDALGYEVSAIGSSLGISHWAASPSPVVRPSLGATNTGQGRLIGATRHGHCSTVQAGDQNATQSSGVSEVRVILPRTVSTVPVTVLMLRYAAFALSTISFLLGSSGANRFASFVAISTKLLATWSHHSILSPVAPASTL